MDAWRLALVVYGDHAENHHGRLHKEFGLSMVRLRPSMVTAGDFPMGGEISSRKNVLRKVSWLLLI